MFDIGWSELLVIGVVALIAIGPKELPNVLRTVGHWMGKIRRMASEFQGQFQEAMREAEMADLKKQVDDITTTASGITNFDPMDSVRKQADSIKSDFDSALADKPADTSTTPATPPVDAAASPSSVSPEAASPATPSPVSSDFAIPQPDPAVPASDQALNVTPSGPQPKSGQGT